MRGGAPKGDTMNLSWERPRTPRRGRFRGRRWAAFLLLAVFAGWTPERARGYRFIDFEQTHVITESSWPPFITFDRSVWPPGEALEIRIVRDPAFSEALYERFARLSESALAHWSSVATADLRFTVAFASPETYEADEAGFYLRLVDEDRSMVARGNVIHLRLEDQDPPAWVGCQVTVPAHELRNRTSFQLQVMVHEFGHCLGLGHTASYPDFQFRDRIRGAAFGVDPVMSYGWILHLDDIDDQIRPDLITPDDAAGISLLRPRPGWLETTGRIWGVVLAGDGTPVRHGVVIAFRVEDGRPASAGVSGFTDNQGFFSVAGLAPGSYVLQAHPILTEVAHDDLLPDAVTDFQHTTAVAAIEVRAGGNTGPFTFVVQPKEN